MQISFRCVCVRGREQETKVKILNKLSTEENKQRQQCEDQSDLIHEFYFIYLFLFFFRWWNAKILIVILFVFPLMTGPQHRFAAHTQLGFSPKFVDLFSKNFTFHADSDSNRGGLGKEYSSQVALRSFKSIQFLRLIFFLLSPLV